MARGAASTRRTAAVRPGTHDLSVEDGGPFAEHTGHHDMNVLRLYYRNGMVFKGNPAKEIGRYVSACRGLRYRCSTASLDGSLAKASANRHDRIKRKPAQLGAERKDKWQSSGAR
jgi:hypothetical protein